MRWSLSKLTNAVVSYQYIQGYTNQYVSRKEGMDSSLCIISEPSGLTGTQESSSSLAKRKHPFGDLGKPTLRGVRKCPKCGTFNGTRGLICKNKECDVVFKERERKKGHSADSVKIITGSTSQLYSVRLRDRGPDYRGFVQLPYFQDIDGNPAIVFDTAVLSAAAVCCVESCNRSSQSESSTIVLKGREDPCVHIRVAINCSQQAEPIGLKNSVLNTLPVTNEIKQAIWLLATETSGPVVQRVTKNIMAVKCKVTAKQPLGFLHCAFFETTRNRQQTDYKFQCTCRTYKMRNSVARDDFSKRCVHYYACVCAFASDEKLSEEFAYFVNLDHTGLSSLSPERQVLPIHPGDEGLTVLADTDTMEVIISHDDLLVSSPEKKIKKEDPLAQASSALLILQEQKRPSPPVLANQKGAQSKHVQQTTQYPFQQNHPQQIHQTSHSQQSKSHIQKKTGSQQLTVDENAASISFTEWLASVTERINQTMHYGFPGTPDPLVFHAPQIFFDCLQQRISTGLRKKRLPNFTTGFVRKEALPLGTFTKYTWHITNLTQVKQIFDTPETSLELARSFVQNRDGTFDPYETPQSDPFDTTKGKTPIRPFELKTFLKTGTFGDPKEVIPFIIEWIPDILPRCHIGELRIKFEYGHLRNGQIENRNPGMANSADIPLSAHTIQLREILPS